MTGSHRSMIFGQAAARSLDGIFEALSELPAVEYNIMPLKEFERLLATDMAAAMRIYWLELVYRSHLAAASGLRRFERWVFAVTSAAASGSFYGVAASLRGLLEACADTHDALADALNNLASSHAVVRSAITGRQSELALHPHLEDVLLHFTYAGKASKHPDDRPIYKPKANTEYLRQMGANAGVDYMPLYRTLCDLAHPADASLFAYVETDPDSSKYILGSVREEERIRSLCATHRDTISSLIPMGALPGLYILWTIARFPEAKLPTPRYRPSLAGPVWADIVRRLEDPSPPDIEIRSGA